MTEFAALRPKTCSYLMDDGNNNKKPKGTKKYVIKRILQFNDYKDCLFENRIILKPQQRFKSEAHSVYSILAFEDDAQRTCNKRYYFPNVDIKNYNIMSDGKNCFDQPMKNNKITYENIRKIAFRKGDDYTMGCLLDYDYFRDNYKMIAIYMQEIDSKY